MDDAAPYVLTLGVDESTDREWNELRSRYFPADRLLVGAHVTLFHALPAEYADAVRADLEAAAAARSPFSVYSTEVRSLGRGVAIGLTAPSLLELHSTLRARWLLWLSPQDRQPLRPHVTVQNKVDPATARATLETLTRTFEPARHLARGLDLWRYRGGPWEPVRSFPFSLDLAAVQET